MSEQTTARSPQILTKPRQLSHKHQQFVHEYMRDLNAAAAYQRVYSAASKKAAWTAGPRLLRSVQIATIVAELRAKRIEAADISAARTLEELRRLAFCDAREFFDQDGNIKPVKEWSAEMGAMVQQFEIVVKNAVAGDKHQDVVHKIRIWDKPKALELLAKHFALLVEQVRADVDVRFRWQTRQDEELPAVNAPRQLGP